MKITEAYISGWKTLFKTKKMWLGLYVIQFVLALLAIWPFAGYFGKTVGHSLDLPRSLGQFDYTFFNDFLIEYGTGFHSLVSQSIGFVLIYFIIAIFLMGGILMIIKNINVTDSYAGFFLGAGHFFWKILSLAFYYLIPQVLLLAIFGGLFLSMTNNMSPFELENELIIINVASILIPIYLILAGLLFMIHDLAKVILVNQDTPSLTKSIKDSFRLTFKHFRKWYPLYLLNMFVLLVITAVYYVIKEQFAPQLMWQIIVVFIFGQLYLFFRVGLKVVNLASMNELFVSLEKEQLNIETFSDQLPG